MARPGANQGKLGFDDNLAQRLLNQLPNNRTDRVYNKHAYFEERIDAHEALCEWLAPIVRGEVNSGE